MIKKVYTVFWLVLCSFILRAEEYKLANDTCNDVSLDTKTGLLTIHQFGGIKQEKPFSLGEDVFTTAQMEGKAAATVWEVSAKTEGSISISTELRKETAGIDLNGVKYTKTFKFIPSVPEIQVTMEFRNLSKELRYAYWGVRNQLKQKHETAFIPRTIGTFPHGSWLFLNFYALPPAWSSSNAENWCVKMDTTEKMNGLAFLLDKDCQGSLYTDKGKNIGFMFDGGAMAPDATVSATYSIRPVKGLAGVTTVNSSFAALITDSHSKILLSVFPYASGQLSGELEIVDKERKSVFRKAVELTLKEGVPTSLEIPHPKVTDHIAVIFSGTINGQKFSTEQYLENDIRMQTVAANSFNPYFLRPALEVKNMEVVVGEGNAVRKEQAVCLFGLFTPFNRFDKILDGWKITNYSVWNTGLKDIPPASTMDENSVMFISNAFVSGMEVCLQRIKSFVANGGVLVVTGGPSAFGTGSYEKNPVLKDILPVTGHPFDLQPAAGRGQIDKGVAMTGQGINPDNAPSVYWLHIDTKIRPSAEILWKAGEKPLLVKDSYGKGKVLCFLGSPLGDPQDGSTPYWDSPEYIKAMREMINTALKEVKK